MATDTIPSDRAVCKGARSALWDASDALENCSLETERLAETAYALACCQVFPEAAQHAFHTLAVAIEALHGTAKERQVHFHTLAKAGGQ